VYQDRGWSPPVSQDVRTAWCGLIAHPSPIGPAIVERVTAWAGRGVSRSSDDG